MIIQTDKFLYLVYGRLISHSKFKSPVPLVGTAAFSSKLDVDTQDKEYSAPRPRYITVTSSLRTIVRKTPTGLHPLTEGAAQLVFRKLEPDGQCPRKGVLVMKITIEFDFPKLISVVLILATLALAGVAVAEQG